MTKPDTYFGVEITPGQRADIEREKAAKKLERSNAGKVLRRFSNKIKLLGFSRKSTWFAREFDLYVQYVHIHKYSFGPCFRLHYGIRVLNDSSESQTLGGPQVSKRLEYGEKDESLNLCVETMFSLVSTEVVPWFESQTHQSLLEDSSCLYLEERMALSRALAGEINVDAVRRSRALFGLGKKD